MPIRSSCTPQWAPPTQRARGLYPSSSAFFAVMTSRKAAPSFLPEALPAVVTPSACTGRSRASPSMVVLGRGNSSAVTVVSGVFRVAGMVTGITPAPAMPFS